MSSFNSTAFKTFLTSHADSAKDFFTESIKRASTFVKKHNPQRFISNKIVEPTRKFSLNGILHSIGSVKEDFIKTLYEKSTDTAKMMLIFDTVSTISSHYNQIRALRKTKADSSKSPTADSNSKYLITQEAVEALLDLCYIVSGFSLNKKLDQKLASGDWLSPQTKDKMTTLIPQMTKLGRDEIFLNLEPVPLSLKEKIELIFSKCANRLSQSDFAPSFVKKISSSYLSNHPLPDKVVSFNRLKTLKDRMAEISNVVNDLVSNGVDFKHTFKNGMLKSSISSLDANGPLIDAFDSKKLFASDVDPVIKRIIPKLKLSDVQIEGNTISIPFDKFFKNGSVYDEVIGQIEGTKTMAVVAFSVLATCIVIPFLKNKFSNYFYNKYNLEEQKVPMKPTVTLNTTVFDDFTKISPAISNPSYNSIRRQPAPPVFSDFTKITSSSNMRI